MWRVTVQKHVVLMLKDAVYMSYVRLAILRGSEVWCLKVG